jgi:CRISPR-associated protein Cmr5
MTIKNHIQKLENGRAEFAYKKVTEAITELDQNQLKEYRSYTKKIPTMILINGFGQTLAFIKAKKTSNVSYSKLYNQLNEYLESGVSQRINKHQNNSQRTDLVEWVISLDTQYYRYATEEILVFMSWLRRFAEGMIEGDSNA